MTRTLLLAVLLVSSATAQAQSTDALNLRPQWTKGQTSRYHFWTTRETQNVMSAGPRSQTVDSRVETEGEVTWRVDDVRSDGSYACTMTLDWMTADLMQAGQTKRNDSRKGSGELPPIHDMLNAMEGVPLRMEVAPDGSIKKVDGVQAMRSRAKDAEMIPEELDFIESATDLATIAGAPASLPVGGSWRTNFRWTHDLGHITQDMTYKLTGVEDIEGIEVANVTGSARMKLEVDPKQYPPANSGAALDVRLASSSYEAQIMFDLARHEAVGRNSVDTRVIDMTIRVPRAPGPLTRRLTETIRSQTLRIEEK